MSAENDFVEVQTCLPLDIHRQTERQRAVAQVGHGEQGVLQGVLTNDKVGTGHVVLHIDTRNLDALTVSIVRRQRVVCRPLDLSQFRTLRVELTDEVEVRIVTDEVMLSEEVFSKAT